MNVIEMPRPKTEVAKENQTMECSDRLSQIITEQRMSAFALFGVDHEGNLFSSGVGMKAQDLALASVLMADMARHCIATQVAPK